MSYLNQELEKLNKNHERYQKNDEVEYEEMKERVKKLYKSIGIHRNYKDIADDNEVARKLNDRSISRRKVIDELDSYIHQPISFHDSTNPYYDNSFKPKFKNEYRETKDDQLFQNSSDEVAKKIPNDRLISSRGSPLILVKEKINKDDLSLKNEESLNKNERNSNLS